MREDLELGTRLFSLGRAPTICGERRYLSVLRKDLGSPDPRRRSVCSGGRDVCAQASRGHHRGPIELAGATAALEAAYSAAGRKRAGPSDAILAPICGLSEAFIRVPGFRNLGVRALQWRRRVHWLHKVLELDARAFSTLATQVK